MARRKKQPSEIGARILWMLGSRSQTWLCEQTGIPKQTLNNSIVRGSMLHADKAIAVARVLDVPVEWLILGEMPAAAERPRTTIWARLRRFLRIS